MHDGRNAAVNSTILSTSAIRRSWRPFTETRPWCPRQQRRHARPAHAIARTDSIGAEVEALTPHSGYHYDGRTSRFFEGWYFKVSRFVSDGRTVVNEPAAAALHDVPFVCLQVALPGPGQSFAWMYSIENPSGKGRLPGVGAQV